MNSLGGIKDDCIVTKVKDDHFYVVLNAANKDKVMVHMRVHANKKKFPDLEFHIDTPETKSLIAVQGPHAQHVLEQVLDESPNLSNLGFMESTQDLMFKHDELIVSRCGYTGEDGFEISLPNTQVDKFMDKIFLVKNAQGEQMAAPVGLGARDSLRIEAGLCLYGHELDEETSPIRAMLAWTISKRRKEELGFLGHEMVKLHMEEGVLRKRCGFVGGKVPIREGTSIYTKNSDGSAGEYVGDVSSGTVTPTVGSAIGMAYVMTPHNKFGTELVA